MLGFVKFLLSFLDKIGMSVNAYCSWQESVLLYEREEEVLVCKSFENVEQSVDDMKTEHFFLSHVDHPNIVQCAAKEPAEIMFNNERK